MTGDRARAERIAEDLAEQFGLDPRRWFGGWSLRRDGRQVAIVMDTLYVRVDDQLRLELDSATDSEPFRYRRSDGREIEVDAYRAVPPAILADPAALRDLLSRAADTPTAVRHSHAENIARQR